MGPSHLTPESRSTFPSSRRRKLTFIVRSITICSALKPACLLLPVAHPVPSAFASCRLNAALQDRPSKFGYPFIFIPGPLLDGADNSVFGALTEAGDQEVTENTNAFYSKPGIQIFEQVDDGESSRVSEAGVNVR